MAFSDIPGQDRAGHFLKRALMRGHVPHAFLFSGMAGIGRAPMALELAKAVNCLEPMDGDACGQCLSCRKIDAGSHPDFMLVEPREKRVTISIEQIRELRARLAFRPFEGKWRVIIIGDARNLRAEAANAMLKMLEEPPPGNLFILIVPETQMLLPTIVSRCCHVRLQPLPDELVAGRLVEEHGADPETARRAARLAGGSLERARRLVDSARASRLQEVTGMLGRMAGAPMVDFFAMTSAWAKESEDLEADLEYIKLWVRDVLAGRIAQGGDFSPKEEEKLLRNVPDERLLGLHETMEQAMDRLRMNANKQLTLERACLAFRDVLG